MNLATVEETQANPLPSSFCSTHQHKWAHGWELSTKLALESLDRHHFSDAIEKDFFATKKALNRNDLIILRLVSFSLIEFQNA